MPVETVARPFQAIALRAVASSTRWDKMRRMSRLRSLLLPLLALSLPVSLAACGQQTEIVVTLAVAAGSPTPALVRVKLHRATPFDDNPETPDFVQPSLDGADLNLDVTPKGRNTSFSLLPSKDESAPDELSLTVTADGYDVSPAGTVDVAFSSGVSKRIAYTLTAQSGK